MAVRSLMSPLLAAAALLVAADVAGHAHPAAAAVLPADTPAMNAVIDYLHNQNSTGFLVIQDGKVLADRNWPVPDAGSAYRLFVYKRNKAGELLEDVASQQKSFVSVLVGVAIDKGMIDVDKAVSTYIGAGWSKASPAQEARIRVIDVLTMSSGLNDKFGYARRHQGPSFSTTRRSMRSPSASSRRRRGNRSRRSPATG